MDSLKFLDLRLCTCILWIVSYVTGSALTTENVFVLTSVKVEVGVESRLVCLIGSMDEGVAQVGFWSRGRLEKNYRVHRYDVIAVELNWTKYSNSVFKYSSVVIRGTGRLTISVVIVFERSVTRYLLLPVSAWGSEYFVTSCHWYSLLHVLSAGDDTEVRLHLPKVSRDAASASQPSLPETKERSLFGADVLVIKLSEYQVYIIDMNAIQMVKNNIHSGMTIESSLPVGVIVHGNLQETAVRPDGNTSRPIVPAALAMPTVTSCSHRCANMMWPKHLLGEEFILTPLVELASVQFMVTSTEPQTTVKAFSTKDQTARTIRFTSIGENVLLYGGIYLISSRPINLFVFLRVTTSDDQSELTWSPVLPISLFHNTYLWNTVEKGDLGIAHYILVVVKYEDRNGLELDSKVLESWQWSLPHGPPQWTTGQSRLLDPGPHRIQSSGLGVRFGCYLLGLSRRVQYVQPVDMLKRAPTPAVVVAGTHQRHRKARDADYTTQGIYATWTPWSLSRCLNPCSLNASIVQSRNCIVSFKETKSACQLGFQENLHEEKPCPNKPTCPENCPSGSWYYNCTNSCGENCIGDCDKYTGACSKCKSGYTHDYKHEHCQRECPQFTYGDACTGNCITKCGADCADRTDGSCTIPPRDNSLVWLSIFISIAVVLLVIVCLQSGQKRKGSDDGSGEASLWYSQAPDVSGLLQNFKSTRDDNFADGAMFRDMSFTASEHNSLGSAPVQGNKVENAT